MIRLLLSTWLLSIAALPAEIQAFKITHPTPEESPPIPIPIRGEILLKSSDTLKLLPPTPSAEEPRILEFEAFTITPPTSLSLSPLRAPDSPHPPLALPPPGHSETWVPYRHKITTMPRDWSAILLHFHLPQDGEIRIRSLTWRKERPGEFSTQKNPSTSVPSALLDEELSRAYPASLTSVHIGPEEITIRGETGGSESTPIYLAEIPMDRLINDPDRFEQTTAISPAADGTFEATLPRIRQRLGKPYDRLTSRWRLVTTSPAGHLPISHARYPSEIACRSPELPPPHIRSKKGLGGWTTTRLPDELRQLDIAAVTVNLPIDSLIARKNSPDALPYTWQGRTYHASRRTLAKFDATLRKAAEENTVVSLILLVRNPARGGAPSQIAHPAATPQGTYAMPNLISQEGIAAYGGLLNFIAERWSLPGFPHGRVHHWIVHNEIDAGWTWTNAGEIEALPYMDLYQRSLRLTDLIIRQYDPHARAFISLTHYWAKPGPPAFYGSRTMLELLTRFTSAEGDFPWALAYHPYPSSLRNPRTWQDKDATFSFDSPKITPRNIEVLDAWMNRPEMKYQGTVRPIHLSENGFNSPTYSPQNLTDQAAAMAYAWKKIAPLPSIQVWHYHNWIDNRNEGGLRIGLRRFPDDESAPLGKKPIWHLYQDLGTPREAHASAPYLETIGIPQWSDILHTDTIR